MELVQVWCGKSVEKIYVCPIGDIQWAGEGGSTAVDHLTRHIDRCLAMQSKTVEVRFIGLGDYTDFASPSNRARLVQANLYDTAQEVLEKASNSLIDEVYEKFLKPTDGLWLGLLEGHHFFEFGGRTSDMILAEKLHTKPLGTSCFVNINPGNVTIWAHHGQGGGQLPAAPLNKLYHTEAGIAGADVYLMGHSTKLSGCRLSRPFPVWTKSKPDLQHHDVLLVNTGGFSKSNVVGHRRGGIVRGDYAEQGMMTPSPLTAPIVKIDVKTKYEEERVRVEL